MHTRGPWEAVILESGDVFVRGNEVAGVVVGRTFNREIMSDEDYPKKAADARLIAAAPELLYALEQIIQDLPSNRNWLDPNLERMAKDAIAKAKGN